MPAWWWSDRWVGNPIGSQHLPIMMDWLRVSVYANGESLAWREDCVFREGGLVHWDIVLAGVYSLLLEMDKGLFRIAFLLICGLDVISLQNINC